MAYSSLSARQLPIDDPFFSATPSTLPDGSGALPLYSAPETFKQKHVSDHGNHFSLTAAPDPHDSQEQSMGRPGHVIGPDFNPPATGLEPKSRSILYPGRLSQRHGFLHRSQKEACEFLGDRVPSVHGNPQHQLGRGVLFPPITSPSCLQTSTNQQHFKNFRSPTSREQMSISQPKSVKHLTCWYWANKGCKLPDHLCLYSHFDTGRLAEAPVQVQRGRESFLSSFTTFGAPFQTSLAELDIMITLTSN